MNLIFQSREPATQDEFRRWLETVPTTEVHHYELLDGFIVREPPAGWPHGEIDAEIVARLRQHVSRDLGRVLGSSQGFELPTGDLPTGDTVEPDAAFVSAAKWQAARPRPGFLRLLPDLVFEILSPSTQSIDRVQKKRIYECSGVAEYVLVDAQQRTVQCFVRDARAGYGDGRTFESHETWRSVVLPGFAIRVGELFADL